MKKSLLITVASLFLLSLTFGMAMAADENAFPEGEGEFISRGFVEADEAGDAFRVIPLTFDSHYTAFAIKVDWDKTLVYCNVRLRDLFISGDSYVAAFGRRPGPRVVSTTNQSFAGVPYSSGVWSAYRSVYAKNTTIWVTPGRITGGLPAGMEVEINIPSKAGFTYRIFRYE